MRCTAIVLIVVAFLGTIVRAEPTARQVEMAVNKGKIWLYAQQKPDGTWEAAPTPVASKVPNNDPEGSQWGSNTALAVYALLACGEKASEPKLARAIEFLQKAEITGTFAVAMKCQVWRNLPAKPEVKAALLRDVTQLKNLSRQISGLTVWDYGPPPRKTVYSLSQTQYAVMGIWAASELGIEQPPELWRAIEQTWEKTQTPEGGWKYMLASDIKTEALKPTTVAMTAAALATLYTAQDVTKSGIYAQGRGNARSEPIERGFRWMIDNFDRAVAPPGKWPPREPPYPQLFAIGRVGLASGLRRFGKYDWYGIGSTWLVDRQKSDGSWASSSLYTALNNTSLALLFLQQGLTPVAFNKLDYTAGVRDPKMANWNQRPRDIANVTRWLSHGLERDLRWQIVGADADATAWLEAPVLYFAGAGEVEFTAAMKQSLKTYARSGGLIVAHADTNDAAFTKSVVELGKELFGPAEWRDLPPNHPIFANQNYKIESMKNRPVLRGIGNGVRELMVLMPTGDHARAWQLRNANARQESWQVMADILSYATDKTTFYIRGTSWLAPAVGVAPKKTVTVGRYKYAGNYDPEPLAWQQLGRITLARTATAIKTVEVEAGMPIDPEVDLLHIIGTSALRLTAADRGAIEAYINSGGTVLFEAAGGSTEFAVSAQGELVRLFGADAIKTLPASHAIFGKAARPLTVDYRPYKIGSIANPKTPQLAGVEQRGRIVALFSREDLSAGLLGVSTDGIMGYTPESARDMMARVILSLK